MIHDVIRNAVAAFIAIAIITPFAWWLMDRVPPYTRVSGRIIPESPAPGDLVAVEWEILVHRNCPPVERRNVTRRVVDVTGKYHEFEPVEGVFGTVTPPIPGIQRQFQLPHSIEPGPAKYQSTACFKCNFMHELWPVCVDKPEITFTILRKTSP